MRAISKHSSVKLMYSQRECPMPNYAMAADPETESNILSSLDRGHLPLQKQPLFLLMSDQTMDLRTCRSYWEAAAAGVEAGAALADDAVAGTGADCQAGAGRLDQRPRLG